MPRIGITFRVHAKYHKDDMKGYATWYIPRSDCKEDEADEEVEFRNNKEGGKIRSTVWVPGTARSNLPLILRISMERIHQTTKQVYCQFVGVVFTTLYNIQRYHTYTLYDIEGSSVGNVRAVLTHVPKDTPVHMIASNTDTLKREMKYIDRVISQTLPKDPAILNGITNINYPLPSNTFERYLYPYLGNAPMWTFPMERETIKSPSDVAAMFDSMYRIALHAMNLSPDTITPSSPVPLLAEILCNICLANTRYMLYVLDNTRMNADSKGGTLGDGSNQTDDWERLCQSMLHSHIDGYDCEDAAELVMRIYYLLYDVGDSTLFKEPMMRYIHSTLVKQYLPLFCIGTILLKGDNYTYHAFVMLLDRSTFVNNNKKKKDTSLLPPCLLECTNYTTSCWEYDGDGEKTFKQYTKECEVGGPKACVLITKNLVTPIYQHLFTCFSSDLYESKGITRIDFKQNGKYGMQIHDMMMNNTSGMEVVITKNGGDSSVIQKLYNYSPRLLSLVTPVKVDVDEETETKHIVSDTPVYDFCYRKVDWNKELYSTIRNKLTGHYQIDVTYITLPGHQQGVRVKIYASTVTTATPI